MEDIQTRRSALEQLVGDLLTEAKRQGASAAEAAVSSDVGLAVNVRLGEVETIEYTRDNGLGVTVYFGQRKGSASTSDFSPSAVRETVEAACNIARFTTEDQYAGLADAALMLTQVPDLDLYHPWDLDAGAAIELAMSCEQAARDLDPRITNSEGAGINSHRGLHVYGNSHGFIGGFPGSRYSLSCAVIGQEGDSMQRDYWWTVARRQQDLEAAAAVGQAAAQRTLARLHGRKLTTRQAPVLFQAPVAGSLLRSFISAIRGAALYRKASFLLDSLDQAIFPEFVHIHENPLVPRGLGSSAFDSEGVATRVQDFVAEGRLLGYVLDSYSARKLGMQTSANAGGVRNLRIDSGEMDFADLLRHMDTGLLVTEMMGQGVNLVTGDYSRGASGFWVQDGEVRYPVEEITIAGNLRDMFQGLRAVGTDVDRRGNMHTGSWLIDKMMIGGE